MSKKKKQKFKSFSDIPPGALTDPQSHPVNNLAVRGAVPLGQSGEQMMSPMDANMNQGHPDIPGGGNTGAL